MCFFICNNINQTVLSLLAACIGGLFSLAGAVATQIIQFKNKIRLRHREDKKRILLKFYNFLSKYKVEIETTANAINLQNTVIKLFDEFDNDADFVFYISKKWLKKDFNNFKQNINGLFDVNGIDVQAVMINNAQSYIVSLRESVVKKIDKRG